MNRRNTSGTTMVEVIVSFTVLILILGIFSRSMALTGKIFDKSNDIMMDYRNLEKEYYLHNKSLSEDDSFEIQGEPILKFSTANGVNGQETFEVRVAVRAYSGSYGKIYDVVQETTEPSDGTE